MQFHCPEKLKLVRYCNSKLRRLYVAFFYFKILIQEVEEMPEEPSKNIEHRRITYNISIFMEKWKDFFHHIVMK